MPCCHSQPWWLAPPGISVSLERTQPYAPNRRSGSCGATTGESDGTAPDPCGPGAAAQDHRQGSGVEALDDGGGDQVPVDDYLAGAVLHVDVVAGAPVDQGAGVRVALADGEEDFPEVRDRALLAADRGRLHDPFGAVPDQLGGARGVEGDRGVGTGDDVGEVDGRAGGARAGLGAEQDLDHVSRADREVGDLDLGL